MLLIKKYTQILLTQQVKRLGYAFIASLSIGHSHVFAMENNGRGTKAIGMANAFVAVSDNCWAISYNPAGLVRGIRPFSAPRLSLLHNSGYRNYRQQHLRQQSPFLLHRLE